LFASCARALISRKCLTSLPNTVRAARNAQAADFDGVEIHAANGCLVDQFIESCTYQRKDI
jgi:2,4-dienoyl-CoA reductase-like NADH-dependent reductase (Old Yellow Enzyme family)